MRGPWPTPRTLFPSVSRLTTPLPFQADRPAGLFAMRITPILAVAACLTGAAVVRAEETTSPAANVSYFRDVLPILRGKNCTGCHQPAKRGGEYVMTEFAGLLKGGESGSAAIVPGKPAESYLIELITPRDGKADMPKEAPPLTAKPRSPRSPNGSNKGPRTTRRPAIGRSTTPTIRRSIWRRRSSSRSSIRPTEA
jgi:hypothetical protein